MRYDSIVDDVLIIIGSGKNERTNEQGDGKESERGREGGMKRVRIYFYNKNGRMEEAEEGVVFGGRESGYPVKGWEVETKRYIIIS